MSYYALGLFNVPKIFRFSCIKSIYDGYKNEMSKLTSCTMQTNVIGKVQFKRICKALYFSFRTACLYLFHLVFSSSSLLSFFILLGFDFIETLDCFFFTLSISKQSFTFNPNLWLIVQRY